jgi:hypothetical protein
MPVVELLAVIFTALALVPAMAHVLELPNKLPLSRESYLTVQRIYRGWSLAGVLVFGALVTTLLLAILGERESRGAAAVAFFAIAATQVVFWTFTAPVNRKTGNWTVAPKDWERLRDRWEISHAANALLHFIAMVCVALAVMA